MDVTEIRLGGRRATLAQVVSAVERQIARAPLARVELRYSTQAAQPLQAAHAQQVLAALLRETGHGRTAVSVRAHEGLIDDASGEHVLRLVPALAAARQPSLLRRFWARWLGRAEAAAPAAPPAPAAPRLSTAESVAHLRKAVGLAATWFAREEGPDAIAHVARVQVRLQELHDVLEPLVAGDAPRAASSLQAMLRSHGIAVGSGFRVTYAFRPRAPGDGTAHASESDLEVVLDASPAPAGSALPGTAVPGARAEATALPLRAWGPQVRIRVLGTTDQLFAAPLDLPPLPLPARLDRDALRRSALARLHPDLLAVASNSCPLLLEQGAEGIRLRPGARTGTDGQPQAMYFHCGDGFDPLPAQVALPSVGMKLVVNSPAGAVDPATGRTLAALVVEITPA